MPTKELIAERTSRGVCTNCGARPPIRGVKYCEICRKKTLDRQKKTRPQRNAQNKKRRERKIKEGLCVNCRNGKACNIIDIYGRKLKNLLCEECYLKEKAYKYLGSGRRWQELKKLFDDQGGRCSLSGKEITIGYDAHIDHIIPRKDRRGLTTIDNLRWVEAIVNLGRDNKTNFNYEEWLKNEHQRYFGR